MRLPYPPAPSGRVVDDHHGELVADPYRPLEDTESPATRKWIAAENTLTERVLSAVGERDAIRARLAQLLDFERYATPFARGNRLFQWRHAGLAAQPALHVLDHPGAAWRVLLDSNLLATDGTVAVTASAISHDGELLAYATSEGGSDWRTWRVREVGDGRDRPEALEWSKFTRAAWRADGSGFYYGLLEAPRAGHELLEENRATRIVFHRLGTAQDDDEVVWERPDEPEWFPDVEVSEDGRFLYLTVGHGTRPENQLHVLDLHRAAAGFLAVADGFDALATVVGNAGRTLFVLTDADAERGRLVAVDLDRPGRRHWRDLVAERADTLLEARHAGGRLVCHHLHDVASRLSVHAVDGHHLYDLAVAPGHFVSGLSATASSAEVFFSTTGFMDSGSVHEVDLERATTTLRHPPGAPIDTADYETSQIFVEAGEATRVPVFLTRRRGLVPDGDTPTLLIGYGGFDVALTPFFSVANALFVERGGILAVANVRGGGEYGRSWYEAGRLANKQNVFDDFCACARHLVATGWTRPGRLGICGASNGGLLVGACLTQHPELFGAAVAEVGVLDLLRYHRFTIGRAWTSDFGDPQDPAQYRWVRAYSPLHNVVAGRHYPATLLTTGDHDDRVVPGHSFKFAAALQAAQGGDAPALVRIETAAGHGAGKPTDKLIAERADVLAFLVLALGPAPETARPAR